VVEPSAKPAFGVVSEDAGGALPDQGPSLGTVSSRLFGRLRESAMLSDAFARVAASGMPEIVLLSGPPGIGKSSLVRRFQSLTRVGRHRFAKGKGEHNQLGATMAPLAQALRSLIDVALAESEAELERLRERVQASLGSSGRLISDLVPEAAALVGPLPPLPDLPSALAQARMQRAVLEMFAVFADPEHPLVLFIDDIQWADAATIATLAAFAADAPPSVFLILSYREEAAEQLEGPDGLVTGLRLSRTALSEVALAPLDGRATEEMVAHALSTSPVEIALLAQRIHAQALGNPFFTEHFLRRLIDEQILRRDGETRAWVWDDARVRGLVSGADVLDFIGRRIARLGGPQRDVLASLALLGGRGDASFIADLLAVEPIEVDRVAMALMSLGLLGVQAGDYRFPHDRVLEASNLLTPPEAQPRRHARIAALLLAKQRVQTPGQVFRAAGHILRALAASPALPLDPLDRLRFAEVLLRAAEQARLTAASDQTIIYLDAAAALFEESWWSTDPAFAFSITSLWCESLLLRGSVKAAEPVVCELLRRDLKERDRALAYRLLAGIRTVQSDYAGATAAALAGLELMGEPLHPSPSAAECRAAYERIRTLLGDRPTRELVALPLAQDPDVALTTSLLSALIACIFTGDTLRFLHLAKIVEITLTKGVTADSVYGIAWYGVMISDFYDRHEDGFAFGQAALALIDRHGFEGQRTGALVAVDQLSPWTRSFEYALANVHAAIEAGHAAGDLAMTCFARNHLVSDLLQMGRPLPQLLAEAEKGLELARRVHFRDIEILIEAQRSLAHWLRSGESPAPHGHVGDIVSISTRFWVHLYDGIGAYLFGDFARAAAAFAEAQPLCWSLPAHIDLVYFTLFSALNAARHLPPDEALSAMEPHRLRLAAWAPLNPALFAHKLLLVEAEMARLRGESLKALRLFDQAIVAAGSFIHERGLARELAGEHSLGLGLQEMARRYFENASIDYRLWGADAKAQRMPWIDAQDEDASAAQELLHVLETVRELTSVSDLERLRTGVLRALMRHADADRGKLLLMHDGDAVIEAEGRRERGEIITTVATMMPTPERIPSDILVKIVHASNPVFGDVLTGPEDPLAANGLLSVIGLPLIAEDRLVGIAYLEACPDRTDVRQRRLPVLTLLSTQAAICLERVQWHARTYENYERRAQAEHALRLARAEMAQTSQLATMGGLAASIAHEINQPLSSIVAYASAGERWLKRQPPNLQEALDNLANIGTAGLRASEIVAALRSLAKQDGLQREQLDLGRVIETVIEVTRPEIEAHEIKLVSAALEHQHLISGDRVQLEQLILNLVNNAIDAMRETPVEDRILRVTSFEREGSIVTRIEDRGCGIAPDALEKIFTPLFSTKSKGMGMGLAICRSVVEAHEGHLKAGPMPERGTYFEIVLPALR